MRRLILIAALLAAGCSSQSGVLPIGRTVAPQIFQKHVNDQGWLKTPLQPINGNQPFPLGLAVDNAHKVWVAVGGGLDKILMNDSQKSFPLSIVPSSIALGSDGYIWGTTNDGIVTKVSPTGVESTFSVAASNIFFNNIVSGPDGALWFPECSSDGSSGGIGRIDTSGSYTFYSSVCQTVVANGPDGNIWFGDDGANIYSMTTGGILIGTYSVGDMFSFFGLTAGSDGALYAVSDAPPAGQSDLIRISTSGIVTHIGGDNYGDRLRAILSGPDGNIWIAVPRSESSFLVKFEVATQSFGERIKGPKGAGFDLITGPDGNIWASDSEESSVDTYVIQVMTATPNDLTVAVGKQANFHVIEANYGGQWTAISTKPSVASVTPNSTNGTFVVTGVAQGMTSVTVSDTKFNSIQVKVTVTSH